MPSSSSVPDGSIQSLGHAEQAKRDIRWRDAKVHHTKHPAYRGPDCWLINDCRRYPWLVQRAVC